MTRGLLLAACLTLVHSYTRYNPREGVLHDKAQLHEAEVFGKGTEELPPITPYSSYPQQTLTYAIIAFSHAAGAIPLLALVAIQWARTKGDARHVTFGTMAKYCVLFTVIGGLILQTRHSFFSDPAVFSKHPAIFTLPHAQVFITAFGLSTLSHTVNTFFVGVKPSRPSRIALNSSAYYAVVALVTCSMLTTIASYVYMISKIATLEALGSYEWEVNLEYLIIGSVFILYDGCNAWVLYNWRKHGDAMLDWKEHHVMNAVWLTSKTVAAVLTFGAHDARMFFTYPGLNLPARLGVQLGPQLVVLLPHLLRIARHVKRGGICDAEKYANLGSELPSMKA